MKACRCGDHTDEMCPTCGGPVCWICAGPPVASALVAWVLTIPRIRAQLLEELALWAEDDPAGHDCTVPLDVPGCGTVRVGVDATGELEVRK